MVDWFWPFLQRQPYSAPGPASIDDPPLGIDLVRSVPETGFVDSWVDHVLDLCGPSRSRQKAAISAAALMANLAAAGVLPPPGAMGALGIALRLSPNARRKRQADGAHYADGWLSSPDRPEFVALQIIEHVKLRGPSVHAREAVYDLLDWHQWHKLCPPPVSINALAVVVGLLTTQGELDPHATKHLLGHDMERLHASARLDAGGLFDGKRRKRYSTLEHQLQFRANDISDKDLTRSLQDMRKSPAYDRLESRALSALGHEDRVRQVRRALEEMAPGIWERFNKR